jgi:Asp-tRNA(Asn)/Glu-tRNA(Gln) amidotransferase A subunit family amidase
MNASVNALVHVSQTDAPADTGNLPLHDMTVALKDNFCTASMTTTCASAMLRGA